MQKGVVYAKSCFFMQKKVFYWKKKRFLLKCKKIINCKKIDYFNEKRSILMHLKETQTSPTLEKLRNFEEMLVKKSDYLEKKIETELAAARRFAKTNKKGKYKRNFSGSENLSRICL